MFLNMDGVLFKGTNAQQNSSITPYMWVKRFILYYRKYYMCINACCHNDD